MNNKLTYPMKVLVPEHGLCNLVRVITAIHVACIDAGGEFFGAEFIEEECQDFFNTHAHSYFLVKPRGAIKAAVKKLTSAVLGSFKNGSLKFEVVRIDLDDEVCLINSWISFDAFEEWCESRSINLDESWFQLYKNEQTIASVACENGENYRRMLEGQSEIDIEEIKKEFDGKSMDELFTEIAVLRKKEKKTINEFPKTNKPLGTIERHTLLTIIAALAKSAKININQAGKAALSIEGLTNELGAHVSKRAIEEHLKKVPDALETRMK